MTYVTPCCLPQPKKLHQEVKTTPLMPTTPPPREPEGQPPTRKRSKHYDAPTRAKIPGVVEFCESEDVEFAFDTPLKQKAFKHFDVAKTQGYDIIKGGSARTFHNKVENEVRGRPYKVTPARRTRY